MKTNTQTNTQTNTEANMKSIRIKINGNEIDLEVFDRIPTLNEVDELRTDTDLNLTQFGSVDEVEARQYQWAWAAIYRSFGREPTKQEMENFFD